MQVVHQFIDLFLHLDRHLNDAMQVHGTAWTYVLLFAIIFSETGFVVTPFLPGDSLLFVVGAFAALGSLRLPLLLLTLLAAAILGNTVNYMIGKFFGEKLLKKGDSRFLKKEHIEKPHQVDPQMTLSSGKPVQLFRILWSGFTKGSTCFCIWTGI